jgi:hypothetical protein
MANRRRSQRNKIAKKGKSPTLPQKHFWSGVPEIWKKLSVLFSGMWKRFWSGVPEIWKKLSVLFSGLWKRFWGGLSLAWKLVAGVAVVATIFAAFTEQQRGEFFGVIGRILPLAAEFSPANEGDVLVIVAEFNKPREETLTSRTMADQLQASINAAASDPQLQGLPIKVVRTAEVITSRETARALADRNLLRNHTALGAGN